MNVLRKLALGLLSFLFVFLLYTTAVDFGFVQTATHPATIKRLVKESGVYDTVVPNLLKQTKTISTQYGDISASDPAIQQAAKAAITPAYVQQNAESTIDSVYGWLDGTTATPDFKIDLTGVKTSFANNFTASAQQKLNTLPACTTAQSLAISRSGSFNPLTATCLPKGITAQSAADQIKQSLENNKDFIGQTTLDLNQLNQTNDQCKNPNAGGGNSDLQNTGCSNKPAANFFEEHKNIPKMYQNAKKTPTILIILTVLVGIGVVFLSRTWQVGLRHAGVSLVIVGLVMLVFSWGLNRGVHTQLIPKINPTDTTLRNDLRALATDITQQIDKNYWWFGGIYTVLGVGCIAAGELFRRRAEPSAKHHEIIDAPRVGGAHDNTEPKKS